MGGNGGARTGGRGTTERGNAHTQEQHAEPAEPEAPSSEPHTSAIADRIFEAMKQSRMNPHANVTFYRLKQDHPDLAAMSKSDFDKAVFKLERDRRVTLSHSSYRYDPSSPDSNHAWNGEAKSYPAVSLGERH